MTSRTVNTCREILQSLVKDYGPFARVAKPLVEKAVIVNAGGDPRTVTRYFEQLKLLDYVRPQSGGLYSFNFKKLDFAQLGLQESLLTVAEEEPP